MISLASLATLITQAAPSLAQDIVLPTNKQVRQMRDAAPDAPHVAPKAPRRILVWGHFYTHLPNPFAAKALEVLGEKTGAFEAVVSQDPHDLLPGRLAAFDGLVMNNIHEPDPFVPRNFGELPKAEQDAARAQDAAIRQSILDFVAGSPQVGPASQLSRYGVPVPQGWARDSQRLRTATQDLDSSQGVRSRRTSRPPSESAQISADASVRRDR